MINRRQLRLALIFLGGLALGVVSTAILCALAGILW